MEDAEKLRQQLKVKKVVAFSLLFQLKKHTLSLLAAKVADDGG
jgi:hypothetical protein